MNQQQSDNWIATKALANLFKVQLLDLGFIIHEYLLGGTSGVYTETKDHIWYNVVVGQEVKFIEINPEEEVSWVEFEKDGEKKMLWYYKNQIEIFKQLMTK